VRERECVCKRELERHTDHDQQVRRGQYEGVCVCAYVCVCVCVCERERERVCVCERETFIQRRDVVSKEDWTGRGGGGGGEGGGLTPRCTPPCCAVALLQCVAVS